MCVGHIQGLSRWSRGWSCVWDISRVRGLDGLEVGHVWDISRVRGLDGQEVGHVCGTYLGLEV